MIQVASDQTASGLKWQHVAAVTLGNALEFYDFLTYAFFSIQIGQAFFPAQSAYSSLMLSLATFGAGFVTRPIGAIVIGNYADRVGRRPAMMLCFVLIGGAIIGMALIPTYSQIGIAAPILAVIARMVQGFSLGGEVGSNTAFLMEAAAPEKRGLIVSWQAASQYIALIGAGLVGVVLTALLPADAMDAYGWRIAFLTGAIAVPFGFWMRSSLPETLHSPDTAHGPASADGDASVDSPNRLHQARLHWRVIVCALVAFGASTIGNYMLTYIVTYAQATLHMSARSGFVATTCGYVVGVATALLGGALSDRIGRRPVNIWGNFAFLLLVYPVFAWINASRSDFALIVGVTLLAGCFSFMMGSIYTSLAEGLPKAIRGSGFGIVYSASVAVFGGTAQLVATWLIHITGSPMAPAWYLIVATLCGQVARMMMAETAPRHVRPRLAEPR